MRSLFGLLLIGSSSSYAEPKVATHHIATGAPSEEVGPRRVNPDPALSGRVFGAQVSSPPDRPRPVPSVVERSQAHGGFTLAPKSEHRLWRPKVMLWPIKSLSSGSGTKGVSLKIRF